MTSRRAAAWWSQEGKGTIRTLITLLFVVVAIYASFKFIPVRARAFQFDDEVREQVVLAGSGRRRVTTDEIRGKILARAGQLGVSVDPRAVQIRRDDNSIAISVSYTERIWFPFDFHYDWTFDIHHEGPSF